MKPNAAATAAAAAVLLGLLTQSQPVRGGNLLTFESEVEGCNGNDKSARAVVEQYLGEGAPDFSLYNTTRDARAGTHLYLKTTIFDFLSGDDEMDDDFIGEVGLTYGMSLVGYLVPGVLCLLFLLFLGLPLIFARCCCPRKCCAPHHPLWGQDNGTLEDFPEPKCCGGSRRSPAPPRPSNDPAAAKQEHDPAANGNPVRPYTYWEQCSPVFFYILFAAFLAGVSISGTLAVGTIVSGLDGGVCSVDILLIEAQNFTYGLSDAVNSMLDVAVTVLDNVAEIVADSRGVGAVATNVSLAGASAIDGIDALLARTGSSYTFDSATLSNSLTLLDGAAGTLDATLDDVLEIIVGPRNTVISIIGMLDSITNTTDVFFEQAYYVLHEEEIPIPAIPMLTDGTPLSGALGATAVVENNAYTLGSTFFVLALVSIPFTVFGILVMGPKCAHRPHDNKSKTTWQCCGLLFSRLSCLWLFLTMLIACIPALILFPLGVILSDVCFLFEDFGDSPNEYIQAVLPMLVGPTATEPPTATTAPMDGGDFLSSFNFDLAQGAQAVITACFEDRSLLEALNITSTLQRYVSSVDFSAADALDLNSLVDVNALTSSMDALTDSTDIFTILAPFNTTNNAALSSACSVCSGFGAAADALNALPFYDVTISQGDRDSMDTCSDCSTGTFPATSLPGGSPQPCAAWQTVFCQVSANVTSLTSDLADVQADFEAVNDGLQSMFDSMLQLSDELAVVAGNVSDLADSVSSLNGFSRCGFIGEFYNGMIASVCPGSTSGLLWLGYSLNIMVITVLFLIVDIVFINCRLGGVGQPRHHSELKNYLPQNIPKLFSGNFSSGPTPTAKVAPALSKAEEAEAGQVIAKAKADDSNGHSAGVAM